MIWEQASLVVWPGQAQGFPHIYLPLPLWLPTSIQPYPAPSLYPPLTVPLPGSIVCHESPLLSSELGHFALAGPLSWLEPCLVRQGCRLGLPSGHTQEATNECIKKWNNKSMFSPLSLCLLLPPSSPPSLPPCPFLFKLNLKKQKTRALVHDAPGHHLGAENRKPGSPKSHLGVALDVVEKR